MRTLLALVLLGLTAFIGTVIAIGLGVNPMVVGWLAVVFGAVVGVKQRRRLKARGLVQGKPWPPPTI